MTYQISRTLRCATARATVFAGNEKTAIEPPAAPHNTRISEPSGAMTSGVAPICLVSKLIATSFSKAIWANASLPCAAPGLRVAGYAGDNVALPAKT
jgi:hypothetical protein